MNQDINKLIEITSSQLTRLRTNDFLEFLNQIGFCDLNDVKGLYNSFDTTVIDDDKLKTLFMAGRARIFSLEGNLLAAKINLDLAFDHAHKNNRTLSNPFLDDNLAYVNYEAGLLYRQMRDIGISNKHFSKTLMLSNSVNLKRLVKYQQEISKLQLDKSHPVSELEIQIKEFKTLDMYIMYALGLHRLGTLLRIRKEYSLAEAAYKKGIETTEIYNYSLLDILIRNSMGFLYYKQGKVDKALGVLYDLFNETVSYYLKAIISENIALVYYEMKEFHKAVDYCYQALNISLDNHVLSQIPDQCLFLGEVYNTNLNNPHKAKYFYKLGYDQALFQIGHGLNLVGAREDAVNEYVEFLQSYFPEKSDAEPPGHIFDFALDRHWQEIKDTFHYNLVMYHKLVARPEEDMFYKLGMKPTTYYSLQAKLAKRGYAFPDFRKKEIHFADDRMRESLQGYIRNLKNVTWDGANARFEKDIFRYLFKQYGYQKTKLSKILHLSYPVVVKKTKQLTQGIALYDDNLLIAD
ncbi:MAG: hypothetical protein H8E61_08655 [Bacteroidetes bacterium]|nr:hypothetical protein [Bacteroidota bacterium]